MANPTPFKVTDVKRAINCALSLGLKVSGFEIGADGRIIVHTPGIGPVADSADADLEKWKRARNG